MEVKKLIFEEKENINKLVKCLEKDKIYLSNIPHQPGEFSAKPFKLTTTCGINRTGDYYQYYKGSKQLETFKNNMITTFKDVKVLKHNNVILHRFNKTPLSIHPQYSITKTNKKHTIKKGLCFILKGDLIWNHFSMDWLPYLNFCRTILLKDNDIKIITKEIKFDSYHYIIKNLLKIDNDTIVMKENDKQIFEDLYEITVSGPFSSGLFPYSAYCNCPIILYKNMYSNIHKNFKDYKSNILIYTKRNNNDIKTRNIINENKIENLLENYCKNNNLIYVSFFYKNYSIEDRIKLFNHAKIVIGPHGATNFHTLFCSKNAKIIEFIFIKDCHSTQLVNLSYGLEYWQIPVPEYGQFEKNIKISDESIQSMVDILENDK